MIYVSHLLRDEEMKELVEELEVGVESIEFSISENLDHLSEHIKTYRKRLQFIGTRELTLHGPFLDLNPVAYDSRVRRVTMERFIQCYEAAQELGAKKIVYHTCYHPGIYFLIGWAERMEEFFHEFLCRSERYFHRPGKCLRPGMGTDPGGQTEAPGTKFFPVPGHRSRPLHVPASGRRVGTETGRRDHSSPHPRQPRRTGRTPWLGKRNHPGARGAEELSGERGLHIYD